MPGRPCNVCITPLGSVGNTQTVLTYSPRINLLLPVSDSNNLWGNWEKTKSLRNNKHTHCLDSTFLYFKSDMKVVKKKLTNS